MKPSKTGSTNTPQKGPQPSKPPLASRLRKSILCPLSFHQGPIIATGYYAPVQKRNKPEQVSRAKHIIRRCAHCKDIFTKIEELAA